MRTREEYEAAMDKIRTRVLKLVALQGLEQKEIGRRMGVSRWMAYDYVHHPEKLKLNRLEPFAEALGTTASALFKELLNP